MRCSVLLPVYNAGPYLAAAVESLLAQSMPDFELIVIDDGSTDESGSVLARFASRDSRVRLISQENSGLIRTLNRAAAEAKTELLFRMDADDVAEPDRFERQLAYLEANPGCVAVGTAALLIDPDDRPLRVMTPPLDHDGIDQMGLRGLGAAIFHPTAAIRRSALEKVGGYRMEYPHAEDVDLFLRLAEVGRLANIPHVGLRYRVHLNSIGYTRRVEQAASAHRAARDACERRGLPEPQPGGEPVARDPYTTRCLWGWWALNDGNVETARYYAKKAVALKPLGPKGWKLLACSLRGR